MVNKRWIKNPQIREISTTKPVLNERMKLDWTFIQL